MVQLGGATVVAMVRLLTQGEGTNCNRKPGKGVAGALQKLPSSGVATAPRPQQRCKHRQRSGIPPEAKGLEGLQTRPKWARSSHWSGVGSCTIRALPALPRGTYGSTKSDLNPTPSRLGSYAASGGLR